MPKRHDGDIDSKAMRTVRFNVLFVGVLITAARLTGPSVFDPALLHLSVGCLVLSTILGIVTYNESYLFVGPQRDVRRISRRWNST